MAEQCQATGRVLGRRTTKIHALTDHFCRPFALLVAGGQAADCTAGALLLKRLLAFRYVLADEGYDSDSIRQLIEAAWALRNIPPKNL